MDDFIILENIIAPLPQDDQLTKPADCCIIPGCRKNKYKGSDGVAHPYCGKAHAEQGKKLGIFRML